MLGPRFVLPVILLLSMGALSGCIQEGTPTPDPAAVPGTGPAGDATNGTRPSGATGIVRVLAITPDVDPIGGALVTLGPYTATTGADGIATLDGVAAGRHGLVVTKDGWRSARSVVEAVANETVEVEVKLLPGEQVDLPVANQTYTREYDYVGVFECSLTYLIITGDCLLAADFLLNDTLGLPVRPGDNTEDQNAFEFPLDADWESVVVEMFWDAPLAPMGEKMQLALEPSEAPEAGHAPKYARVTGGSPLAFTVHRGVAHETASRSADGESPDMPNQDGGEVVTARAYVLGELHNPGGTNFLGIGAAYGQRFEIYVTVFYGEAAPDGFNRIP